MKTPTKKQLDEIWAQAVKARAKHRSEYSGKDGVLNAHHIEAKPNYRLRWELKNGVCITNGEHFHIAHNADRQSDFKRWAMKLRGLSEDEVLIMKRQLGGSDRWAIFLYLKQKVKEWSESNKMPVSG